MKTPPGEKQKRFWQALWKGILDALFPLNCLGCGVSGELLCPGCAAKVPLLSKQTCPYCQKAETPDGRVCWGCRGKGALEGILGAASYSEKEIKKSVHAFKYGGARFLHKPLALICLRALRSSEVPLPDLIVPVPLHPKRLRWRSFNQSELLAKEISEGLGGFGFAVRFAQPLRRVRNTKAQMLLKRKQRLCNVQGAFVCSHEEVVRGKHILLVDDVATTGATLSVCAQALKSSGAKTVWAVVVGR